MLSIIAAILFNSQKPKTHVNCEACKAHKRIVAGMLEKKLSPKQH